MHAVTATGFSDLLTRQFTEKKTHALAALLVDESEKRHIVLRTLDQIFQIKRRKLLRGVAYLNEALDLFEYIGLDQSDPGVISEFHSLKNLTAQFENKLLPLLRFNSYSLHYIALKRRIIALSLRFGEHETYIATTEELESQFKLLKCQAIEWKQSQPGLTEKRLTPEEISLLQSLLEKNGLCDLILHRRKLALDFFEWVLRDKLPLSVFAEFPYISSWIIQKKINGRLGHYRAPLLTIHRHPEPNGPVKTVDVLIEGRWYSLMNLSMEVTFRGDYTLTLEEIFNVFENKDKAAGNLEVFSDGINNWNAHHLGYYDALSNSYKSIDIKKEGWWTQLPAGTILSLKEASYHYHLELDGTQWIVAAKATRQRQTLDPNESHAYLEIVIPNSKNEYRVYTFGKYALRYATNMVESALAFTDNLEACVAYPDETQFYTHRQHSRIPFTVSPEEGMRIMKSIGDDISQAIEESFIYQWESENCAKWTQDKLEENLGRHRIPNLFQIPMLETEPSGPSRFLFRFLKQLPRKFHSPILSILHYFLGAWRVKTIKKGKIVERRSLTRTFFWKDKIVYLPAMLYFHDRKEAHEFMQTNWQEVNPEELVTVFSSRGAVKN